MEAKIDRALEKIDWNRWDGPFLNASCDRELRGVSVHGIYPEVERVLSLFQTFASAGAEEELRLMRDVMVQEAADNPVEFTAKYALHLRAAIKTVPDGSTSSAVWKRLTSEFWAALEAVGSLDFGDAAQLYESLTYCF